MMGLTGDSSDFTNKIGEILVWPGHFPRYLGPLAVAVESTVYILFHIQQKCIDKKESFLASLADVGDGTRNL